MLKMMTIFFMTFTLFSYCHERPNRVYADITGDLFHAGHVEFFKKARTLGDVLVIGVLADEVVATYKRTPVLSLKERVAVVEACKYVDEVIVAPPLVVSKQWLLDHEIDVVVHGDDFDENLAYEQYGPSIDMGIFQLVSYTPGISTTDIIQRIQNRDD